MPRSQLERVWLIGGVLVGLLLAVIAYAMFIGPQRGKTSDVNSQVGTAQTRNSTLQARIATLTAQNKNLARYQQALSQAELALPTTSGLPDFLRSLQSIGASTATDVTSLTVGTPTPVLTTGTAATPAATTAGSAAASAAPKIFALPISAQVTGNDAQLSDFLTQLQAVQPRAVLIGQLTEGSVSTGGTTQKGAASDTLQITMQAFVSPASAAEGQILAKAAGK